MSRSSIARWGIVIVAVLLANGIGALIGSELGHSLLVMDPCGSRGSGRTSKSAPKRKTCGPQLAQAVGSA